MNNRGITVRFQVGGRCCWPSMAEAVIRWPLWQRPEFSAMLFLVGCVVVKVELEQGLRRGLNVSFDVLYSYLILLPSQLIASSIKTLLSVSFALYSQFVDKM
jgi:hypothetical protein